MSTINHKVRANSSSGDNVTVEQRLEQLEEEIRQIRKQLERIPNSEKTGWRALVGMYENDPDAAEAMRLGAEIRKNDLVPVWRKRRRKGLRKSGSKKGQSKE